MNRELRRWAGPARWAVAVPAAALCLLAAGCDDDSTLETSDDSAAEATSSSTSTTTSTTVPEPEGLTVGVFPEGAMYPWVDAEDAAAVDQAGVGCDPVQVAEGFAEDLAARPITAAAGAAQIVGDTATVQLAAIGEAGQVYGAMTTVTLGRVDGGTCDRWTVTLATSDDVSNLTAARVDGSVQVSGEARGYEGTMAVVVTDIPAVGMTTAYSTAQAGAGPELEPFAVVLDSAALDERPLAVVVSSTSGAEGAEPPFAAVRVQGT